jgi:hypothetical protein
LTIISSYSKKAFEYYFTLNGFVIPDKICGVILPPIFMFANLHHVSDIEVNLQDIELAYLLFNIFWTLKLNPVSKMPIFQQPRELKGSKNVEKINTCLREVEHWRR